LINGKRALQLKDAPPEYGADGSRAALKKRWKMLGTRADAAIAVELRTRSDELAALTRERRG